MIFNNGDLITPKKDREDWTVHKHGQVFTVDKYNPKFCSVDLTNGESVKAINWELANYKQDTVNNPQHYNTGSIEVITYIEDKNLGFNLGNVVKYISRAEHKGSHLTDLKKAKWYLEREIMRIENAKV